MADQKQVSPSDMQLEYQKRKSEFENCFKEFHKKVFSSKLLDRNKSPALRTTEQHIIDALIKSAVSLDNANVGEGLLALSTTAIRELLTMRDRVNELEYKLLKVMKDLGIDDGERKT